MYSSTSKVDKMIMYYDPFVQGNRVLSIDNVVLAGYIPNPKDREQLMTIMDEMHFSINADVRHWSSYRIGSYHDQFAVKIAEGVSFWLGVGLNQVRTEWGYVCLDFNPNKVSDTDAFRFLHGFLLSVTRAESRKIKRFDLAVDIPVPREKCYLIKDSRVYYERRHGKEWTQYLGAQSSHVGRVKLYNKQVESKLNYPLTRLELTLDTAMPYEEVPFPQVYYLDNMQITLDDLKITDTDNFILGALLQGYGSVKQLGRKERAKMERLMQHYITEVRVTQKEYTEILQRLNIYVHRRF